MSLLLTLLALLLVCRFLVVMIRVKGSSMLPTLRNGDLLIVWRALSRKQPCRRGDIVICHYPGRYILGRVPQRFVKRVVGLPGERLAIRGGELFINGAQSPEPYLDPEYAHPRGNIRERLIGRHRYFVMGDHRDSSHDSRAVGTLHRQELLGRVIAVIHIPEKASEWLEGLDRRTETLLRRELRKARPSRPQRTVRPVNASRHGHGKDEG